MWDSAKADIRRLWQAACKTHCVCGAYPSRKHLKSCDKLRAKIEADLTVHLGAYIPKQPRRKKRTIIWKIDVTAGSPEECARDAYELILSGHEAGRMFTVYEKDPGLIPGYRNVTVPSLEEGP